MNRLTLALASWFGSGYAPIVPGTFGTAAGIPLYLLMAQLPLPLYIVVTVAFTVFACRISDRAQVILGQQDPGKIVIDEVAGLLVTMIAAPLKWQWVLAGFVLFRFFDIVKIPPARYFDRRMKSGTGVVLDDIAAGIYACIALHLIGRWL